MDLNGGHLSIAPGFVLRAAKSWEDLLTHATRRGLPDANVREQFGHTLGTRDEEAFDTTPDLTVDFAAGRILVDAKYKGRANRSRMAVSASDVYEGLAFLRAANCRQLVLLFPRRHIGDSTALEVGTATQFEHIEVGEHHIYAFEVEARGISAKGGYQRFSSNVGAAVRGVSLLPALATA